MHMIVFICTECDAAWATERAAVACCGQVEEPEAVTLYECPYCNTRHDSEDEARACCSRASEVTCYTCDGCGALHRHEEDADDCCRAGPDEIALWQCGHCAEEHGTEKEARQCCRYEIEVASNGWLCPACGDTQRPDAERHCLNCGAKRGTAEPTFWRCHDCETKNALNVTLCTSCLSDTHRPLLPATVVVEAQSGDEAQLRTTAVATDVPPLPSDLFERALARIDGSINDGEDDA
jgi:hypothetical protein